MREIWQPPVSASRPPCRSHPSGWESLHQCCVCLISPNDRNPSDCNYRKWLNYITLRLGCLSMKSTLLSPHVFQTCSEPIKWSCKKAVTMYCIAWGSLQMPFRCSSHLYTSLVLKWGDSLKGVIYGQPYITPYYETSPRASCMVGHAEQKGSNLMGKLSYSPVCKLSYSHSDV